MTTPLLSAAQMAAIQAMALPQFTTPIVVKRPTIGSDELGDDAVDLDPETIGSGVKGWLSSAPVAEPSVDAADLTVANTYRLGVPVGTDIRPRDFVEIGGQTYRVTDTNPDETWPVMLSVTLRLGK